MPRIRLFSLPALSGSAALHVRDDLRRLPSSDAGAFRPDGRLASLSAFLRRPGGPKLTALRLRMGKYLPPPGMPPPVLKMLREGESATGARVGSSFVWESWSRFGQGQASRLGTVHESVAAG